MNWLVGYRIKPCQLKLTTCFLYVLGRFLLTSIAILIFSQRNWTIWLQNNGKTEILAFLKF